MPPPSGPTSLILHFATIRYVEFSNVFRAADSEAHYLIFVADNALLVELAADGGVTIRISKIPVEVAARASDGDPIWCTVNYSVPWAALCPKRSLGHEEAASDRRHAPVGDGACTVCTQVTGQLRLAPYLAAAAIVGVAFSRFFTGRRSALKRPAVWAAPWLCCAAGSLLPTRS